MAVDWEALALDLCDLLDLIEVVADDEAAVREAVEGRHVLAEKHGLTVEFLGEASGAFH